MLYAGIDVGVKNLCWCIIDREKWLSFKSKKSNDPGIVCWKNVTLIETKYCSGVFKTGKKCNGPAKYTSNSDYFCGRHKPVNSKPFKQQNSKSKPIVKLLQLAFEELDKETLFSSVYSVVIELQLKKNPVMKRMSNALEAYFIMRYKMCQTPVLKILKYSSAKNKLTVYDGPKIEPPKKGKIIKDIAKLHTEKMLENCEILKTCYFPFKKRDDLADAFLHCVGSL